MLYLTPLTKLDKNFWLQQFYKYAGSAVPVISEYGLVISWQLRASCQVQDPVDSNKKLRYVQHVSGIEMQKSSTVWQ